jgi:hypothetical protein
MNCFNIREIQSILKGRHFSDNVSIHEFHDYIDNTVISLRFKNNNISTNKPKILLFFENGIINFKVINDEFYLPKVENQLSGFTFLKSTSFTTTLLKFVDNYCPSVIGMFATGSLNSSVFNLSNMFHYSELTFFTNILNLSLDSLNNKLTNIFSINSFTSTRSSSFNNKGFSF